MPIDLDAVNRAPLFTALDEAASASLRAQMDLVKISKGSVLFSEGADGDHLYVIVEGKLKLGTSSGDGRENLLSILGPGEMFGELSLFDPGREAGHLLRRDQGAELYWQVYCDELPRTLHQEWLRRQHFGIL